MHARKTLLLTFLTVFFTVSCWAESKYKSKITSLEGEKWGEAWSA